MDTKMAVWCFRGGLVGVGGKQWLGPPDWHHIMASAARLLDLWVTRCM
jgi:hypothetical protein